MAIALPVVAADLVPIFKSVAVIIPLETIPSALAVTAEPTTTEVENVPTPAVATPVTLIPLANPGAL